MSVFSVASDGTLTQVSGSPFATGAKITTAAMFSPNGRLLAASNQTGPVLDFPGQVSVFSVGSGGALTAVSGSPFATGNTPDSVAFSADGGLLAVANFDDSTVSMFHVHDQDGNSQGEDNSSQGQNGHH